LASQTADRLTARAAAAGIQLTEALSDRLVVYFDLLARWNRTINLTSLSDSDEAIDRLLLEPVVAAAELPQRSRLIDLGSGGGSPAIPLALALSASLLVMVESKTRKAAFLREAVRELGLPGSVEGARIEDVAVGSNYRHSMEIVSVRGVKLDPAVLESAAAFLAPGGVVALFQSHGTPAVELPGVLRTQRIAPLLNGSQLALLGLSRCEGL
jgi:16S rRNA (guanine527-N7)-methyltransferase